jgi:hypothetical protein
MRCIECSECSDPIYSIHDLLPPHARGIVLLIGDGGKKRALWIERVKSLLSLPPKPALGTYRGAVRALGEP